MEGDTPTCAYFDPIADPEVALGPGSSSPLPQSESSPAEQEPGRRPEGRPADLGLTMNLEAAFWDPSLAMLCLSVGRVQLTQETHRRHTCPCPRHRPADPVDPEAAL